MNALTVGRLAGVVSVAATAQAAFAADIKILTAGAMRAVVVALQPEIERDTGHKLTIDNATAGALAKRMGGGEAFDIAINTPAVVDDLTGKGIGGEVRAKTKLKAGGYVAGLVVSGEAEIAVHQISEIVPVKGAVLVGPLPAEIQNTPVYAGGLGAAVKDAVAAKAVLQVLAGPASAPILKAKGMEKP